MMRRKIGVLVAVGLAACSSSAAPTQPAPLAYNVVAFADSDVEVHDVLCQRDGINTADDTRRHVRAFQIDRQLVSCTEYQACIASSACPDPPASTSSCGPGGHVAVEHDAAVAYCRYRNGDLPTSDQWQRAVRGLASVGRDDACPRHGACVRRSPDDVEYLVQTYFEGEWLLGAGCEINAPGLHETGFPIVKSDFELLGIFGAVYPPGRSYFRCAYPAK